MAPKDLSASTTEDEEATAGRYAGDYSTGDGGELVATGPEPRPASGVAIDPYAGDYGTGAGGQIVAVRPNQ